MPSFLFLSGNSCDCFIEWRSGNTEIIITPGPLEEQYDEATPGEQDNITMRCVFMLILRNLHFLSHITMTCILEYLVLNTLSFTLYYDDEILTNFQPNIQAIFYFYFV